MHRYLANRGLKIPAWIECKILYFSDINYQKSWINWHFFCISFYETITIIIPGVKTFISQDSNFNILKLQSYAISTNVSALQKYRGGTQVKLVLHFGEELEFLSVRKGKMKCTQIYRRVHKKSKVPVSVIDSRVLIFSCTFH